ncbi:hypothetical protein Tco_1244059 [Tanacetum coccineum]
MRSDDHEYIRMKRHGYGDYAKLWAIWNSCGEEMASSLVKRVASSLKRVRAIASSSRFFNTFEYDQRNSEDDCILKCDHKYGSCVHYVVNSLFDPRLSPTRNLARLLTVTDGMIGYKYGIHVMTKWSVVEDDKALYLLRDMPSPKFLAGLRKGDAKELVTLSESAGGTQYALCICLHVSCKLQNPQAIRIIVGVGAMGAAGWDGRDTGSWDADYPFERERERDHLRFLYQKGSSVSSMSRRIKWVNRGR